MDNERTIREQEKVLENLREFIAQNGFAPTERELCKIAGISSRGVLHRHLVRMKYPW